MRFIWYKISKMRKVLGEEDVSLSTQHLFPDFHTIYRDRVSIYTSNA